mmetsp:Transcript_52149/g.118895  ORF Transcript_52149/g.118895 Transcript_52149/m.118895 type:complete len:245 (-) Transcript_52149:117-851(-)
MHVGVEEGAGDHREGPDVEGIHQSLLWVRRVTFDPVEVAEGHPVEAVHREHLGRAELLERRRRRRHARQTALLQKGPKLPQILGLLGEIQLSEHGLPEVGRHVGKAQPPEAGAEELEDFRGGGDEPEVGLEGARHLGLLHLDHHSGARRFEDRAVNLGDGGRGEGLLVERCEQVVDWPPEVLLHDAFHHFEAHRRRRVQALLELKHVLGGKEGRARGDELAQLDVGGPEALEEPPEGPRGQVLG